MDAHKSQSESSKDQSSGKQTTTTRTSDQESKSHKPGTSICTPDRVVLLIAGLWGTSIPEPD
jgi:hypothetical protein